MTFVRIASLAFAVCLAWAEEIALEGGGSTPVSRLEAHGLAVAVLPALGAKIISLRGPDGYEWLSRSGRPYRARGALAGYGDGEFDGADEIFPTMDACDGLPGHGEAWRSAWKAGDGPGMPLVLEGRLRPYRLTRRIELEPGAVQLSYELENRGDAALRYVYLFHPLFSIAEPLRMEFPPQQQVVVTNSQHHVLGAERVPVPWDALSATHFAAATASMAAKRFWSLAVAPAPAFVRLRRPGGASLTMTWSADALPHLAVWCSEASPFVGDLAHLAPEPSTGAARKLSDAVADGTAPSLAPGAVVRWRIRFAFAD